jgi:uncharacterized membrane protein HdeD (DUF308 family)
LRVAVQLIQDVERLSEYWWLVFLRGLLAVVFAAAVWVATGVLDFHYGGAIALVFIQACFGSYLLIAGLFSITISVVVLRQSHWRATLMHSAFLILLAAWLLFSEADAIAPLAALVAVHAVLGGMGEISLARRLRRHQIQSAALLAAAVFSFGAATMLLLEMRNIERLVLVTAVYAAVFGVVLIGTSFQLRSVRKHAARDAGAAAEA